MKRIDKILLSAFLLLTGVLSSCNPVGESSSSNLGPSSSYGSSSSSSSASSSNPPSSSGTTPSPSSSPSSTPSSGPSSSPSSGPSSTPSSGPSSTPSSGPSSVPSSKPSSSPSSVPSSKPSSTSSSTPSSTHSKTSSSPLPGAFTVSIVDSDFFTPDKKSVYVNFGEDASFNLSFIEGYTFSTCSYSDFAFELGEGGNGTLVLKEIMASTRVRVEAKKKDASIVYHYNGGRPLQGTADSHIQEVSLEIHFRPNTSFGVDKCYRDGYQQIGWNTRSNGSGKHIGLGSRVDVAENEMLDLYAEWIATTPESNFTMGKAPYHNTIVGFNSSWTGETLVIPEKISNNEVYRIEAGAFQNVHAKAIYLPRTLELIEDDAFVNCTFEEMYCFDKLQKMGDMNFNDSGIKTFHVNACRNPSFLDSIEHTSFADNADRLLKYKDEKKLIFFGGCSMSYGLSSPLIEEKYGDEYQILDLGVIGGANAVFQLEIIKRFLKEGDVFIHAPEEASDFQFFQQADSTERIFSLCEGNYDLLSFIDPSSFKNFYSEFAAFVRAKNTSEVSMSYDEAKRVQNEYGDVITERVNKAGDIGFSDGKYTYEMKLVSEESIDILANKYDELKDMGIDVYFSYAPMNYSNLKVEDITNEVWTQFSRALDLRLVARGYQIISYVKHYLYSGRYFYDTDYHLTNEGALMRTRQLLSDLEGVL